MRYAFTFDASACSGCKACQIACKDKNQLPLGVLWRRVYEVTGGGWRRAGAAWVSDVFAYNLSIGCNHCAEPICMEVCPASAYTRRADGVVLLDAAKCVGCRYCQWACPYGAPQFDPAAGRMSKCNFCVDELDAGRPPACVAACPMRVLNYVQQPDAEATAAVIPPLPEARLTRPALAITAHPAAALAARLGVRVANREETG